MSKHELGLRLIAIGKLLKAVTLVTIGVGALALAGHGPTRGLTDLASALGIDPGSRHVQWAVAKVSGVSVKHLEDKLWELRVTARDQAEWNPVSRPDHALNY